MNRVDVIRIAREAGATVESFMSNPPRPGLFYMTPEMLERFAVLVAVDEREACALACEQLEYKAPLPEDVIEDCASAIRARGKS